MKKPWIGIPTQYDEENGRYGQDRRYLDAIEWAGGLPLLIPVLGDTDMILSYADRIDGLLLPGSSNDVDPVNYDREPHERIGRIFSERDRLDFTLLDIADNRNVPVLGICYGAQSLNVFRGGSLIQDIPSEIPNAVSHDREGPPEEIKSHVIHVEPESQLEGVLQRGEVQVNSYHHQSIGEPGRDLRVVATAPDGVVEAVEDTGSRFVLGVQWHPETGWRNDPLAGALFSALVESAIIGHSP